MGHGVHDPAEGLSGPKRSSFLKWKKGTRDHQQGHVDLAKLFKRWNEIRGHLLPIVYNGRRHTRGGDHWKRVEMVMQGLMWQATTGECFASAQWLADRTWGRGHVNSAHEKTWDRCLAWLRSQGLVVVTPLFRPNGQRATNLVDFSSLWRLLLRLLTRSWNKVERKGGQLWVKLRGFWYPAAVSGEARAQPPPKLARASVVG